MKTSKPVPTVAMGPYMAAREIAKRINSGQENQNVVNELIRDLLGTTKQLEPAERMQIYTMVKSHPAVKDSNQWGALIEFDGAEDVVPALNLDGMATAEEYQDCAYILHLQSSYCECKASAHKMRVKGDIQTAQAYERAAQDYYDKLPVWAQW